MLIDRVQLAEQRFRTLVVKWLESLPPDGWEGTSRELGDTLAAFADRRKVVAYVPTCPGRKVAALTKVLSAPGFTVTATRTKRQRTLRFTRGDK